MMTFADDKQSRSLPPLRTDGRIDVLTGLDAPEIFYKFLERAIANSLRHQAQLTALLRFRIDARGIDRSLEFEVAALADFLRKRTRSDENLVRIGEGTFLILARVANTDKLENMTERFMRALPDFEALYGAEKNVVDNGDVSPEEGLRIELMTFSHRDGESMVDLLERSGV